LQKRPIEDVIREYFEKRNIRKSSSFDEVWQ
jgi:hypothetical protein